MCDVSEELKQIPSSDVIQETEVLTNVAENVSSEAVCDINEELVQKQSSDVIQETGVLTTVEQDFLFW